MGMTVSFLILAILTLAGGVAAMTLRRLVHCALALAVSFAGLAGLYVNLGAEFAGLAQLLVYVGAIAILIVFAILLTRGSETESAEGVLTGQALPGPCWRLQSSEYWRGRWWVAARLTLRRTLPLLETSMRDIGFALMQGYVLPLEVIALMLTAAMIGAVILALRPTRAAANRRKRRRRGIRSCAPDDIRSLVVCSFLPCSSRSDWPAH